MLPVKFKLVCRALFFTLILSACHKSNDDPHPTKSDLRVLGYIYSDYNWFNEMSGIDLTKLTDLNLAFINPDEEGVFPADPDLQNIVQMAHQQDVRIYVSIGGGDPPPYLGGLLTEANREKLIAGLLELVTTYNFDGVDVDIEGDLIIGGDYAAFVDELSANLKAANKLMTSALASWNANEIDDHTLGLYDFINIMSYDNTGPWNPSNPGQHSPVSMALNDFDYFNNARNIDSKKLLIGLPFYGYMFKGNTADALTYREIVTQYPGAENKDEVEVSGGGKIYYNGIPTIKEKVALAKSSKAAGVMIWELHQDTNDAKSLLKAINESK